MSMPGHGLADHGFCMTAFDAAAAKIEANERVAQERWAALEFRLGQIDAALERLEKRIWVGVYGVACFLLAQMAEAVMQGGSDEVAAMMDDEGSQAGAPERKFHRPEAG
jgi:hypothetical protein